MTGGTRGLGYGMAEGYMEAGCEVAIVGTSDECGTGWQRNLRAAGLNAMESKEIWGTGRIFTVSCGNALKSWAVKWIYS